MGIAGDFFVYAQKSSVDCGGIMKRTAKKISLVVIGTIIAAYGIDLAIHAGFGGATLAVLWQGMAETFHITLGQASFIIAADHILLLL